MRRIPNLVPELRKLAQAILDGIDPAVRMAAAMTAGAESAPASASRSGVRCARWPRWRPAISIRC